MKNEYFFYASKSNPVNFERLIRENEGHNFIMVVDKENVLLLANIGNFTEEDKVAVGNPAADYLGKSWGSYASMTDTLRSWRWKSFKKEDVHRLLIQVEAAKEFVPRHKIIVKPL